MLMREAIVASSPVTLGSGEHHVLATSIERFLGRG